MTLTLNICTCPSFRLRSMTERKHTSAVLAGVGQRRAHDQRPPRTKIQTRCPPPPDMPSAQEQGCGLCSASAQPAPPAAAMLIASQQVACRGRTRTDEVPDDVSVPLDLRKRLRSGLSLAPLQNQENKRRSHHQHKEKNPQEQRRHHVVFQFTHAVSIYASSRVLQRKKRNNEKFPDGLRSSIETPPSRPPR